MGGALYLCALSVLRQRYGVITRHVFPFKIVTRV